MSKIVSLPGIIDPHVHFRTPGAEYKEDFKSGSISALAGGISCVLDMPNTNPPTTIEKELGWKIKQTKNLPINFGFHFGATNDNLKEIQKVENKISSIKVYFGSSTGDLLLNNLEILEKLMRSTTKIITVHAEDEEMIQKNIKKYKGKNDPKIHSLIRSPDAAASAVEKLLNLARKTNHLIYFCHISTKDEINLIKKAKKEGFKVYAEVTPHHLFLDDSAYKKWGNFVKVNPPLRSKKDIEALWEALNEGIIDTVGSDHAPHLPKEKNQDYWQAPSGIPGIETTLPLLLNAVNEQKLSLDRLVELISINPAKIFKINLKEYQIKIDLNLKKEIRKENLHSKCGWSPYEGLKLIGWPI